MNCTSEVLHLIPIIQEQLETSQNEEVRLIAFNFVNSLNEFVLSSKNHQDELKKKRNLLECVSFVSSTILYTTLYFIYHSQLIDIKSREKCGEGQKNEQSKVFPHEFVERIDT